MTTFCRYAVQYKKDDEVSWEEVGEFSYRKDSERCAEEMISSRFWEGFQFRILKREMTEFVVEIY